MDKLDVVIIGAGVIGLAIGRALARRGRNVTLLEAEPSFGTGISSRNSEVIHAGIYYPNKSLKATLCVRGKIQLYAYCQERSIPYQRLGKLIVATNETELEVLKNYQNLGEQNGVTDLTLLTQDQISQLEPSIEVAHALYSPSTGILNSHELMLNLLTDIEHSHGTVVYNTRVLGNGSLHGYPTIRIAGEAGYSVQCNLLINAAGLAAERIAIEMGANARWIPKTYFAKGCYFHLSGKAPFSHLIYPVANLAGLGVHATLDLNNQVRFGPDVEWISQLNYDVDDSRKPYFVEQIKRYYPALEPEELQADYAGVRPKVVGQGMPPGDFIIDDESQHGVAGLISCHGIESPGLTAAFAIADHVATLVKT